MSTIKLLILLLRAVWLIGSVHAGSPWKVSCCQDGMHLQDGCSRFCIVGGFVAGTLDGGRIVVNLEFFRKVLGILLVFGLL